LEGLPPFDHAFSLTARSTSSHVLAPVPTQQKKPAPGRFRYWLRGDPPQSRGKRPTLVTGSLPPRRSYLVRTGLGEFSALMSGTCLTAGFECTNTIAQIKVEINRHTQTRCIPIFGGNSSPLTRPVRFTSKPDRPGSHRTFLFPNLKYTLVHAQFVVLPPFARSPWIEGWILWFVPFRRMPVMVEIPPEIRSSRKLRISEPRFRLHNLLFRVCLTTLSSTMRSLALKAVPGHDAGISIHRNALAIADAGGG
jgi:hypothetical protein